MYAIVTMNQTTTKKNDELKWGWRKEGGRDLKIHF